MDDIIPSRTVLYRRLGYLRVCRLAFVVGKTGGDGNRPKDVWLNRKHKTDNAEHELLLSQVLLAWLARFLLAWGVPVLRGRDVAGDLLPDAEIGRVCIELDTGSMDHNRLEAKLLRYLDAERPVLVITSSERRVETILRRSPFLDGWLLCCTFDEARAMGVVRNRKGKTFPLIKALKKALEKPQRIARQDACNPWSEDQLRSTGGPD